MPASKGGEPLALVSGLRQVIAKPRRGRPAGRTRATPRGLPSREPILSVETWRKVLRRGTASDPPPGPAPAGGARARPLPRRRWLLSGGLAALRSLRRQHDGHSGRPQPNQGHLRLRLQCQCLDGQLRTGPLRPAEEVERYVTLQVLRQLDDPYMAKRLRDDPDPDKARLLEELHRADDDMRAATERLNAGRLEWADFDYIYAVAKARAEAARAGIAALAEPTVELPPADQIRERWDTAPEAGGLTLRQKRTVIERFVDKVVIRRGPGRPPRGLSTEARIAERLDPERGWGIKWRD